jgi:hypothetical protein
LSDPNIHLGRVVIGTIRALRLEDLSQVRSPDVYFAELGSWIETWRLPGGKVVDDDASLASGHVKVDDARGDKTRTTPHKHLHDLLPEL